MLISFSPTEIALLKAILREDIERREDLKRRVSVEDGTLMASLIDTQMEATNELLKKVVAAA